MAGRAASVARPFEKAAAAHWCPHKSITPRPDLMPRTIYALCCGVLCVVSLLAAHSGRLPLPSSPRRVRDGMEGAGSRLVVLGSGLAGLSAALEAARATPQLEAGCRITCRARRSRRAASRPPPLLCASCRSTASRPQPVRPRRRAAARMRARSAGAAAALRRCASNRLPAKAATLIKTEHTHTHTHLTPPHTHRL